MTQNLQIVLALLGAAVVLIVYMAAKLQQRQRQQHQQNQSSAQRRAPEYDAADDDLPPSKIAPRIGGRDDGAVQRDDGIPVLDDPIAMDDDVEVAIDDAPLRDDAVINDDAEEGADESRTDFDAEAEDAIDDATGDETDAFDESDDAPQSDAFRPRVVDGFKHLRQIDYWAQISGERDVGRETVLAIFREGAAGLRMPHGVYGVKLPDGGWCDLEDETEDSRFGNLMLTLQLASRDGVVTQLDLSRFETLATRLAVGTGREYQMMTTAANALAQGNAIAEFIAHFDSVATVQIHPADGEPFDGATIARHARKIGLEPDSDGHYARFQPAGRGRVAIYGLANTSESSESGAFDFDDMESHQARGLVFFTHPARNRSPGAVFAEMANTAIAFAARIEGVVDLGTGSKPTQDDIDALRRPIDAAAAEMESFGIAAGSEEAVRIF